MDKTNTQTLPLAKSVTLATFFNYTAQTLFDPRVVYDSTESVDRDADAFRVRHRPAFLHCGINQR